MKKTLLFLFLLISTFCYSQENCNNGIDDDGDGKIDLNDSDCVCNKTTSILANPSFEEKTNCPYNLNDLSAVNSWVKGTQPSPDYINCEKQNAIYNKHLENFPDGDGIIRAEYKNSRKEYLATKLQTPLIAGTKYQLKLNIATLTSIYIDESNNKEFDFNYLEPVNITLFGCNNRDNLPLYTNSSPDTFDPSWIEIGHVTYQPQSVWGEITMTFTPSVNINSIMLGPPSGKLPPLFDTLETLAFLYDNLILNTSENFGVTISETGSFCNGNLQLTANITKNLNSNTTYQWYKDGIAINGATNKTNSISSIPSNIGAYSVKITNGNTCFVSSNFTTNNSLLSPETIVVQPSCNNTKGSITVKETGLNYSFDNGKSWQTNPVFIPTGPGKYYVKTKSTAGCISSPSIITIIDPVLLDRPSFSIVQPTCNTNGSITITTPGSQYSFDDGLTWNTNPTKSNLPAGNYNIKIKNNLGCESYSQNVLLFIPHLDFPKNTFTVPSCTSGGSITITTSASEYSFDNGVTWTTNPTATNLPSGYYFIKIKDQNGCESNTPHEYIYLKKFYAPFPKVRSVAPSCANLGSITILTTAAEYSFDNGITWTTNPKAINLESGTYAVKTKNSLGCETEPLYIFLKPYFLPNPTFSIIKSTCSTNGSITITTPAAEYSFDRGLTWTTNPIMTVPTVFSSYFISIKNEFGCISDPQYISMDPEIYTGDTKYVINKEVTCTSGASVTITSPAEEYSFDDGQTWSTNPTAVNLKASDYYLKTRNSNGCETYQTRVSIYDRYLSFPTCSVVQPECNKKGSITITTPAPFYSFDGGVTWGTSAVKSNLEEGNYYVVIKNEEGCTSLPFHIHLFSFYLPMPYLDVTQPTVCGENATGSITIRTKADFYSFNDGATWSTNPTAENLPVDSEYRIKIKNSDGCVSESIYINFIPFDLRNAEYTYTNPTCNKGGSITITTQAPFYSFDGGQTWGTNPTALNLPPGFYYPKIKNEFGCVSPTYYSVNFTEPKLIYPDITVIQPKCGSPGSITVNTPAAQYSFDGGRTWSNSNKVLNIPASIYAENYYIIIKDETGCESYQSVVGIPAIFIETPEYTTTEPTCEKGGSISIDPIGDEYSFDNGMTWTKNPVSTDLDEGTYYIILKNKFGCQSYPKAVNISRFYLDEPSITLTQPNCESLGSIKFTSPAFEYIIDNGENWSSNPVFSNLKAGDYYLIIKSVLGCESSPKLLTLTDPDPAAQAPGILIQQPSSCTSSKGTITAVSTTAYQYSFDNGINWTSNNKVTGLDPGNYFVRIRNSAVACPSPAIKVTIDAPLDAITNPAYTAIQPTSCTNPFGSITILTPASKYSFDNGISWQTSTVSGNLTIGTYKIKIQNSAGCISDPVTVQINPPADYPFPPSYNSIQPNCTDSKGKIHILSNASEYSFDNGITWTNNPASGSLEPAEYYLKIKNSSGCISEAVKVIITKFINLTPLPETLNLQTFCVEQNATLNEIQITGQNIKWYSNLTGGTLVSSTTVAQDKATYYASQTINGCESERVPVKINIQVTLPPTGNATQSFCTAQNPTIANLQVTGNSIKWYDAVSNGSLLTAATNLVNGKTYYASQTENNCEGSRLGVTISIVNTPSAPTANATQSFCKSENATLSNIQISGQNIKWFDTNLSASVLPNTTLLENNKTYYASQTVGCESDRTSILVQIYDTPLPTGNNNQQFCIDEIATIENIQITGTNIKWYDAAVNGNILSDTDLLQSKTYYATQTLNSCESKRFAVTVKIQDTQIPIADSPQQFCIQKNAKIRDIKIIGQNIKWYETASSTIGLSETTELADGITYYASQTSSNCESDRIPVTINILEATTPDCIHFVDELPYPKFFTPNNDGYNDTWTIDFIYLAPNTGIKIFDRYGKLIKELRLDNSWDGTYLGHQEPASDYWFTVTRLNGKEFRGHFSLKR
ncbi:T9SS type B sorting domain-containing protein [Flavobacterium sp. H4147]|uniref:Ig-like domain-containing protein n=1 Tax=Flavobacterium sp. H4147 TaxID=3034149 RepID=UPI0023EB534B|nr:T9SS type B sorting domain-containing protein [Flavobacterium sp. H4147]